MLVKMPFIARVIFPGHKSTAGPERGENETLVKELLILLFLRTAVETERRVYGEE